MRYLPRVTTLTLAAGLLLGGCASSPQQPVVKEQPARVLYESAKESLANGVFNSAIRKLDDLLSRYPFGPLAHQAQLDLIYAYYKAGKEDEALAQIDRFIRLNPDHPDLDYVYYMRGLVNLSKDSNMLHELVGIDRADRDPEFVRQAFDDFKTVVSRYPDSKYAADARQRMLAIKSQLARHELAVARYYMKRAAYLAAANRARYVVENYQRTPEVEQALEILLECYTQLDLPELRDEVYQLLKLNYPDNPAV